MSTNKVEINRFIEVIDRLMDALNIKNEYNMAELLGFKRDTFSARKKRGALPVDKMQLLCSDRGINFNWVMTGEGERLDSQRKATAIVEGESESGYIAAVMAMMRQMDADTQKDIFLSVQKEQLLRELLAERLEKKAS
jgi:hypothetical protein